MFFFYWYALHRDKNLWGDDALQAKPERFWSKVVECAFSLSVFLVINELQIEYLFHHFCRNRFVVMIIEKSWMKQADFILIEILSYCFFFIVSVESVEAERQHPMAFSPFSQGLLDAPWLFVRPTNSRAGNMRGVDCMKFVWYQFISSSSEFIFILF